MLLLLVLRRVNEPGRGRRAARRKGGARHGGRRVAVGVETAAAGAVANLKASKVAMSGYVIDLMDLKNRRCYTEIRYQGT